MIKDLVNHKYSSDHLIITCCFVFVLFLKKTNNNKTLKVSFYVFVYTNNRLKISLWAMGNRNEH